MWRSISTHTVKPDDLQKAIADAYGWVCESGGTIIFGSKGLRKYARTVLPPLFGKHSIRDNPTSIPVLAGIARGERYLIQGPRVAIIDGGDLDMKRLEVSLSVDEYDDEFVEELRSYTKTIDTHPQWTAQYNPYEV